MRPSATTPLKYPQFRRIWTASVVTNVGQHLQAVAGAWLMLELTGSAFWTGVMVAAPTLPMLFVAMPAGAMADLFDRRRVLLSAQATIATSALLMGIFTVTGLITPEILLGLGLLLGIGQCFNIPSWQAIVPDLVPNEHVPSAVSLNSASFNLARSVGPALGGALVAAFGPGPAFMLNAFGYLAVISAIYSFKSPGPEDGARTGSISTEIASGLRYARFTPQIRWLLLVAASFAITSGVVQSVLPTYTEQSFTGTAALYGILLGCMGAGALIGVAVRPMLSERLGKRMVPSGIAAFGIAGVGLGLAPEPALAGLAMVILGLLWTTVLSTLNATTQLLAPAWVRGRIMSLYTLSFMGILPLGHVLAGSLADMAGPRAAVVALSLGTLAVGLIAFRIPLPQVDQVETPKVDEGEYIESQPHPRGIKGGPVMVITTWTIADDDLKPFLNVMEQLRRVRLRTGAYRWRLYRDVTEPHRMTEVFLCTSWEAHLAQHQRIDHLSRRVIERARAFDVSGDALTHHLAGVDTRDPNDLPNWEELGAHADMHRTDGSVPLPAQRAATGELPMIPTGTGTQRLPVPGETAPSKPREREKVASGS